MLRQDPDSPIFEAVFKIFIFSTKLRSKLIVKHFDIFMALLQRTLDSCGDRKGRIRSTKMGGIYLTYTAGI